MSENFYAGKKDMDTSGIKYFFESVGKSTIIKAIEYSPIQNLEERFVYNLGFGL